MTPTESPAAPAPARMPRPSRRPYWLAAAVGFPLCGAGWMFTIGRAFPGESWATGTAGLVLALLVVCTVTDLARHKIFNWATYTAFLYALLLNAAASASELGADPATDPPGWERRFGAVGLGDSLLGAVIGFVVMLLVYRMSGRRGAGDVKLGTAVGACLGLMNGLNAILCTYVIAGVTLAAWLVLRVGPGRVLKYAARKVGASLLPGFVAPPPEGRLPDVHRPIPMGGFFLAGTAVTLAGVLR